MRTQPAVAFVSEGRTNWRVDPAIAGGGILNSGTLTLSNVTVSGNKTGAGGNGKFGGPGGAGGGISNTGTLTLTGSTINANQTGHGGACRADQGGEQECYDPTEGAIAERRGNSDTVVDREVCR